MKLQLLTCLHPFAIIAVQLSCQTARSRREIVPAWGFDEHEEQRLERRGNFSQSLAIGHRRTDRQRGRSHCTHRQQNKYPHVSVCLRFVELMLSMYAFCLGPINRPSPLPILSPPSQSTHSPSTHFHCQFTIPTPWESPMHSQANSAEVWHKKKQLYTTVCKSQVKDCLQQSWNRSIPVLFL